MSAVMISAVASPPPALPRCGRPPCPPVGMLADGTPVLCPDRRGGRRRPAGHMPSLLAGHCVRSPPTSARTAGPNRPTVRPSAWNAASHSRGRKPASSGRPRSPHASSSTRRYARAAPRGASGPAPGNSPGTPPRRPGGAATRSSAAGRRGRRWTAVQAAAVAQANTERARARLARVAADVARRHGYPDIGAFVLARVGQRGQPRGHQPGGRAPQGLAVASPRRHRSRGRRRRAAASAPPAATPGGCPSLHRLGYHRRGQLPDRAPPRAAPDGERHRRRGRHVPPCRRSGAAPSRAGPDGPRGEASRGRASAPPGWRHATASTASRPTSPTAGRQAGPGGPWPRNPGSPRRGCAGRAETQQAGPRGRGEAVAPAPGAPEARPCPAAPETPGVPPGFRPTGRGGPAASRAGPAAPRPGEGRGTPGAGRAWRPGRAMAPGPAPRPSKGRAGATGGQTSSVGHQWPLPTRSCSCVRAGW